MNCEANAAIRVEHLWLNKHIGAVVSLLTDDQFTCFELGGSLLLASRFTLFCGISYVTNAISQSPILYNYIILFCLLHTLTRQCIQMH